ncbi:thioredoxin domain-containing protein [Kocuria salsicia]|uniref:thioredoxin domain-containing protein n=1 Tax=Kocuria salsicia TaxID=664639 RepID=UPI0006D7BD1D|nr:DUF255 domain-containing protein [Kocuria salsicia]
MPNRLAGATSPYLLQHAENPVDWWQFSPEAFAEAQTRDVPVLLSVGYAACHWCHVMAHESFEDPETGDYVNAHFVPVKVDREQRPDVDSVYMAATQLLTGQGGWPMTVFLTPEGRAFHAGTYYPPRPAHGRPSFMQVMVAVTEAWAVRRDEVERSAEQLTEALERHPELVDRMLADAGPSAVVEPAGDGAREPSGELAGEWLNGLELARDAAHEGFGGGAKFPPSPVLEALTTIARSPFQAHEGTASSWLIPEQRRAARELLSRTLDAIVLGALQDHVGGGFFRYSVTPDWSVPHYEKMLYDNAQLLRVLARTVVILEREGTDPNRAARYRHAATALVHWLHREMVTPQGAFAASLDADSDPSPDEPHAEREGAYYTFSRVDEGLSSSGGVRPEPVTAAWGEGGACHGDPGRVPPCRAVAAQARAYSATPGRQGGHGVERHDDRGPRRRRRAPGRPRVARPRGRGRGVPVGAPPGRGDRAARADLPRRCGGPARGPARGLRVAGGGAACSVPRDRGRGLVRAQPRACGSHRGALRARRRRP